MPETWANPAVYGGALLERVLFECSNKHAHGARGSRPFGAWVRKPKRKRKGKREIDEQRMG